MPARFKPREKNTEPPIGDGSREPGSRAARIDAMMNEASEALTRTDYSSCERIAREALRLAHGARDFERMARIVLPLLEARRQKRQRVQDAKRVVVVNSMAELEGKPLQTGCYLLKAPGCVGADGRALMARADQEGVPVIVVVHEPLTRTKDWPIVALGPATVRARIEPAKNKPAISWFLDALDALGEAAIDSVDAATPPQRVDQLMACVEALADHEGLHQALAEECQDALHWTPPPRSTKSAKSKSKNDDPDEDE